MWLILISLVGNFHALHVRQIQRRSTANTTANTTAKTDPEPRKLPFPLAGGFGGGGCFSTVSQIGFLQGMLAKPKMSEVAWRISQDIGSGLSGVHKVSSGYRSANNLAFADGVRYSCMGSSSGGSLGLGMAFATMQISQKPLSLNSREVTGTKCITGALEQGTDWIHMMNGLRDCGGCAASNEKQCSWNEAQHLFGVANACVLPAGGEKVTSVTATLLKPANWIVDQIEKSAPPSLASKSSLLEADSKATFDWDISGLNGGQVMWDWMWGEYVHMQFFDRLGMPKNMRMNEVAPALEDARSMPKATLWSVFWSTWHGKAVPLLMGNVQPGYSGSAADSTLTIVKAVSRSSDSYSFLLITTLLQQEIGRQCNATLKKVSTATNRGLYPFPFAEHEDIPGKEIDFLLRQVEIPKSNPISLPMKLWKNSFTDPRDLMQFIVSETTQQQRLGVLSAIWQGKNEWFVDGASLDTNAIGETLRLVDKMPGDERPRGLVSLVTGPLTHTFNDNVKRVISYFHRQVFYLDLWVKVPVPTTMDTCKGLETEKVNNPNFFFGYKSGWKDGLKKVPTYAHSPSKVEDEACTSIQNAKCPEYCSKDTAISLTNNHESCQNLRWQAANGGTMYVNIAKVVSNKKWGIVGEWYISLFFSILEKNSFSESWLRNAYQIQDLATLPNEFDNFPGPQDPWVRVNSLGVKYSYALLTLSAYKGFMLLCTILQHDSGGSNRCDYCINNEKECAAFSPIKQISAPCNVKFDQQTDDDYCRFSSGADFTK